MQTLRPSHHPLKSEGLVHVVIHETWPAGYATVVEDQVTDDPTLFGVCLPWDSTVCENGDQWVAWPHGHTDEFAYYGIPAKGSTLSRLWSAK